MASFYENAVRVVSAPCHQRDPRDIQQLIPWFKKKAKQFEELSEDIITDIVRNCELIVQPRDAIIIRQGDIGDCFYVILRGTVSIYINNAISDEEDLSKIGHAARSEDKLYDDQGKLKRDELGKFIANLEAGKSFGELALINKDCIRNASIVADEETDLLMVNRTLYNRSLKGSQVAEFEARKQFVDECGLFKNWHQKHKKQLAMSIRLETFPFEQTIVRQGDTADNIYFMTRGEAKILVDVTQHYHQYPQFLHDSDHHLQDEIQVRYSLTKLEQEPRSSDDGSPLFRRRKTDKYHKPLELCIVREHEILGDAEFVLDLKTYVQSVVCNEPCQVYALDAQNYDRLVWKRNPRTVDSLREAAEIKVKARLDRLRHNVIPLFKMVLQKLTKIDVAGNERNITSHPNRLRGHGGGYLRRNFRERRQERKKKTENSSKETRIRTRGRATQQETSFPPIKVTIDPCEEAPTALFDGSSTVDSQFRYDSPRHPPVGKNFLSLPAVNGKSLVGVASADRERTEEITKLEQKIRQWLSTVRKSDSKQPEPATFKLQQHVCIPHHRELYPETR